MFETSVDWNYQFS